MAAVRVSPAAFQRWPHLSCLGLFWPCNYGNVVHHGRVGFSNSGKLLLKFPHAVWSRSCQVPGEVEVGGNYASTGALPLLHGTSVGGIWMVK